MKSYNHLYEQFMSDDNIRLAIKNASKNKKHRKHVARIYNHQDRYIPKIKEYAMNFKNMKHKPIVIYDGITRKKRTIIVPKFNEQIVHHMLVNVLKPIFMKPMYEQSYGSVPNKGAHIGKKVIQKWITNDKKNVKYCLKMDIRKYFERVDHNVLKAKLARIIHDERFLNVLFEVIDVTDTGIPLGFYTSQWFANFYLTDLDHYIKEELHAAHYARYMDDMVIFGSNKKELHRMMDRVETYLNGIGLELNGKKQVFRFDYIGHDGKHRGRFLDFMGFRFYRDRVTLRKSIMLKATRKAKTISKKRCPTVYDCKQMLSYLGWLKSTDTYRMYLKYIKPNISFQHCKRRISRDDRRKEELTNGTQLEENRRKRLPRAA